ncbi:MAG: HAMP domain-containing sensor histidine kinase, partial [Bacteroidota bacterium]
EKLKEQNIQLTKLNTELDRFVYSASHDLRAPLASLLGLIDLATRERNTEATDQYLDLMSKSINTLDTFISNITEYSRNIRLETKASKIDFKAIISESFNHIQYMIPGSASFDIKVQGTKDFYSDPERISMILNNLISNSIRYKSYERDPRIKFSVKFDEHNATIRIADNGMGIHKKHLKNVFDMFYRANEHKAGSGLGLYIVKETIEKLEGSISIKSELNKGTTITMKIPNMADQYLSIPK